MRNPENTGRGCGSSALSHDNKYYDHDKTVTVRHRETLNRDDGTSECLPVMGWIVVECFFYNIATGENLPTSIWYFIAKDFVEPANERKQMSPDKEPC